MTSYVLNMRGLLAACVLTAAAMLLATPPVQAGGAYEKVSQNETANWGFERTVSFSGDFGTLAESNDGGKAYVTNRFKGDGHVARFTDCDECTDEAVFKFDVTAYTEANTWGPDTVASGGGNVEYEVTITDYDHGSFDGGFDGGFGHALD